MTMNATTRSPSQERTACRSPGMAAITVILLLSSGWNSASAAQFCGCTSDHRYAKFTGLGGDYSCKVSNPTVPCPYRLLLSADPGALPLELGVDSVGDLHLVPLEPPPSDFQPEVR